LPDIFKVSADDQMQTIQFFFRFIGMNVFPIMPGACSGQKRVTDTLELEDVPFILWELWGTLEC